MDRILDIAEERGEEPRRRLQPEYKRFAMCTDSDDDQTESDSANSEDVQARRDRGTVAVPRRVYVTIHGRARGVHIAQGGILIHQNLIREFGSLESTEKCLKGVRRLHEQGLRAATLLCS